MAKQWTRPEYDHIVITTEPGSSKPYRIERVERGADTKPNEVFRSSNYLATDAEWTRLMQASGVDKSDMASVAAREKDTE